MITTRTRLQYARGFLELGMTAEAKEELEAIAEDDRSAPEVLAVRVLLAFELKDWDEMAEHSRTLAGVDPGDPQWWVHWAYALREKHYLKAARQIAERGLELHPNEAILHFNLACYLSLLGETDEASAHLDAAIRIDKRFQAESVNDPDLEALWESFKS